MLRAWTIGGPLRGTELDAPALEAGFAAYPGLFALGRVWLPVEAPEEGRLDFRTVFAETRRGTALLHTFIEIPADGTYTLRVGSDDGVRVDIDGHVVHRNDVNRHWTVDEDRVRVTLSKGWHRVLVRVVELGGAWQVSVRMADDRDRPLDVPHHAEVPAALREVCRLDEAAPAEERALVTAYLAREVARIQADLKAQREQLATAPEGYVTFAEYAGARDLGLEFFEALANLWSAASQDEWDREAFRAARRAAVEAARGFSAALAGETDEMAGRIEETRGVWERLGSGRLSREAFASANLEVALALARTRGLVRRVANERILTARFENDIRNWRQRDVTVRVVDTEGGPVENADVEIVQTQHDFLFGCNLFAFRRWKGDRENAEYERWFRRCFNFATLPAYWSSVEPRRGQTRFEELDRMIEWAEKAHVRVRVHPLLWSETAPRWLKGMKREEVAAAAQAHVERMLERYGEKVSVWDVVSGAGPDVQLGDLALPAGRAFGWAAEAGPKGALAMNHHDAAMLERVGRHLRADRAPVGAVGIEAHQHTGTWPVDQVRQVLDQAAAVGLPVHVSAVTILGGPDAEAEQAEAVRRFYTAAFAHPRVASITWWDLSDRFAWKNAPGGLLREDLSPKAAYRALERLLTQLWRTDAAGRTDADGRVTVRAFFGQYRIRARAGRRRQTVNAHVGRREPGEVEVVLPAGK